MLCNRAPGYWQCNIYRNSFSSNQVPGRRQCCATGHRGTGNATFIETDFEATRYRGAGNAVQPGTGVLAMQLLEKQSFRQPGTGAPAMLCNRAPGYWHCNETTAPIVNPWGIGPPIGHPRRSRASGLCPPLVATRYRGAGNALQPDIGELAMHRNCRPGR